MGAELKPDDTAERLRSLRIPRDSQAEPARQSRWAVRIAAAGVGLILFGGGYLIATPSGTGAESVPAPPAATQPSTPDGTAAQHNSTLSASGYITARRRATVSSDVTGRIVEALVEEGARVEKGQVLARLDSAMALLEMRQSKARAEAAAAAAASYAAKLADARRILARSATLAAQELTPRARLSSEEATVASLEAEIDRAQAEARALLIQTERQDDLLRRHEVRAPFSGVIVGKFAQPGEIVSPSSAGGGFTRTGIYALVDMESLEIEVDVSESQIQRVRVGQRVEAVLTAYPDWIIPAHVVAVIPAAIRERASVRVRIAIDALEDRILPDMAATVRFLDAQPRAATPRPPHQSE